MVVNPETAAAIVALLQDGRSERYVAQQYQISNSTVHRIFSRFLATGAYTRRPGTGPQRITSARDDRFILLQSLRDRRATAVEIRNQLQYVRNTNVSERTIRRRLGEANLSSCRPATGPQLLRRHRVARLQFARNHAHFTENNWPALSPDANPIEHVWDMLGRRIRSRVPAPLTLNQLQEALLEEWELIPQQDISHLILGMPRRIQAIIRARGGNTHY